MIRVVIDTNVVVSGLLNPYGSSAQVLRLLIAGEIQIAYDDRIWIEYEEVLKRKKFKFNRKDIHDILEYIRDEGANIVGRPLKHRLPDPSDEKFLEVALSAQVEVVLTGNKRHFPEAMCRPVRVLSPQTFIEEFRKR